MRPIDRSHPTSDDTLFSSLSVDLDEVDAFYPSRRNKSVNCTGTDSLKMIADVFIGRFAIFEHRQRPIAIGAVKYRYVDGFYADRITKSLFVNANILKVQPALHA